MGDAKNSANAAKSAVGFAKNVKRFVQIIKAVRIAATSSTGVGALVNIGLLLKDKIRKFQVQVKKAIAGAAAAIALMLYMLWLKFMGALAGLAFGLVTGAPLLFLGPVGIPLYVGWTAFWTVKGFADPLATIHLATHPWEAITKPLGWVKDQFANLGGGIQQGAASAFSHSVNFFTGAISWGWNTTLGWAGNAIGTAGSLIGKAFGAITGGSTAEAATVSAVSVGAGTGAVATATVVASIITNSAFFTPSLDTAEGITPPGENEFYILTKTASPPFIDNAFPRQDVTFTITVTAKSKAIVSIGFIDNLRYLKGVAETPITVPIPITCTTPINAGSSCTISFSIPTTSIPDDSLIINSVVTSATLDGGTSQAENISVTVPVGAPPTNCPTRWPITGSVTQGPEGATSHADEIFGGYEALDIGAPVGTTVYNTVDGVVDYTDDTRGTLDQRVGVIPNGCTNLAIIHYWHLSGMDVSPGQSVIATTTIIGRSGHSAPHLHYQFNNTGERNFRMEPPNIPTAVPRTCNGDCSVTTIAP